MLGLTIIIWGASFPVIKYSLAFISPLPFLLYRFALASLILTPVAIVAWRTTGEYLTIRRATLLSILGLFGTLFTLAFLYFGINLTLASRAVLILAINPAITQFLLWITGKATYNRSLAWGSGLIAIGLAVLFLEPYIRSDTISLEAAVGNGLVLLSGICWSVYTYLSKTVFSKQTNKNSPITQTTLSFLSGTAALAVILAATSPDTLLHPVRLLPTGAIPGVLYTAVLSSILGFMTFEAGAKLIKPTSINRYLYLQPLVAIPLSLWWLSEPMTLPFFLSAGIIGVGVFLATTRSASL